MSKPKKHSNKIGMVLTQEVNVNCKQGCVAIFYFIIGLAQTGLENVQYQLNNFLLQQPMLLSRTLFFNYRNKDVNLFSPFQGNIIHSQNISVPCDRHLKKQWILVLEMYMYHILLGMEATLELWPHP